jgi:hypothetical protein
MISNNNINFSNKNNKTKKKGNKLFGILMIIIIIVGVPLGIILYLRYLLKQPGIDNWKPNVTDTEKINRTKNRGTIVSMILMSSALLQSLLKGLGASTVMLLLLYGFIMASVIGFLGDQGYGTDDGFSLKEIGGYGISDKNKKASAGLGAKLKYVFGTLATNKFWKYIITIFLDMFISSPIQSIILAVFNSQLDILKNTVPLLPSILGVLLNYVIKNFDNVLQSFVAFITFLSYTNDTRFKWAYPGDDIDPSLLISTPVIKLSTVIAGVVYLIANISADFNIIDGATLKVGTSLVDRLDRKTLFVIVLIGLITIGSMNDKSFMEKTNNTYYVKPLHNMSDDKLWHMNDKLNTFVNKLMRDKRGDDATKCYAAGKQIGIFNSCNIDQNTGDYIDDRNGVLTNVQNILNEHAIDNDNTYIKVNDEDEPLLEDGNLQEGTKDNGILLSDYIASLKFITNKPCFIPDHDYICNCGGDNDTKIAENYDKYTCTEDKFKDIENNIPLNENNGHLVKKIVMGLYRNHISNIENKFKIIDKFKGGFIIFCCYTFIGIIVPFIPLKFIYTDKNEFKTNARLWKVILVFIVIYSIIGVLYYISSKSPSVETLIENENHILNKEDEPN